MIRHGLRVKQKIIEGGIKRWLQDPLSVTARNIAVDLDMKPQTIIYHYNTNANLRDAVAAYAVKTGNSRIIAQLIATKHKSVAKMSKTEKAKHFNSL